MCFLLGPFLKHEVWLKQRAHGGKLGDETCVGQGLEQTRPALAVSLL